MFLICKPEFKSQIQKFKFQVPILQLNDIPKVLIMTSSFSIEVDFFHRMFHPPHYKLLKEAH